MQCITFGNQIDLKRFGVITQYAPCLGQVDLKTCSLLDDKQNICVVGDDDQGLYRFRGATIRNILEFPRRFPEKRCAVHTLTVNYRIRASSPFITTG